MTSRIWLVPLLLFAAACTGAAAPAGNNAAAVQAAPAGPGNTAPAGHYRLQGGPDTASGLELLLNGRFRFFLSAGAVDLHAEGRWTSDGRTVVLNTEPRPVPATFTQGPVTRTDESPLVVLVNGPGGHGIAGIDLKMGFTDGRELDGYTQDYGWHYVEDDHPPVPAWVELSLAMYGLPPHRFPLDAAAGNKFTFTLVPNDLGVQDFHDTALAVTPRGLVIDGPGGEGVYAREAAYAH
jgi:hypothetical protein